MGGNPWIPTHFIYPSNIPQHLAIPPAKKCLPSAECTPPHIERASPFGLQYAKQRKLRSRSSDCPAAYRSGDKDSPHKKNRPFCCSAPLYCHNAAPNTHPATEKWKTQAYTCSAVTKDGLDELWDVIQEFTEQGKENGVFLKRRQEQSLRWVRDMIDEHLHNLFFNNIVIQGRMGEVENAVLDGEMSESQAVEELIGVFDKSLQ